MSANSYISRYRSTLFLKLRSIAFARTVCLTPSSFSLVNPPEVYTPTVELPAGMATTLSLNDLAAYFNRTNVRISGSQAEFNRTQMLPDYFEEVELKLFFDAAERPGSLPDELSSLSQTAAYRSWIIKDVDAVIAFVFKQEKDIPKFMEFLGEKEVLTPPTSSTRKAFFVHGTNSDSERWMEHPLTETVLLCIANTDKYDDRFSWEEYNHLTNNIIDRNKSAQNLAEYVLINSQGFNEIVLIGHSHGGNVALQAINQLVSKGKTVYLITVATPAYNDATVELYQRDALKNCEFIGETAKSSVLPTGGVNVQTTYVYKNPENPANTKLKQHIHLWNVKDGVAGGLGGLIGSDYYNSNGITNNIEVLIGEEYNDPNIRIIPFYVNINPLNWEMINAHGFDANRPQLIYEMLLNGIIKPLQ